MTDWTIIAVRLGLYVSLSLVFGLAAFASYGLRTGERGRALPLRPWLVLNALVALLLSFGWIALMASSMAGTPVWPVDWTAVEALRTGSAIGRAWEVRMAALGTALLATLFVSARSGALVTIAITSGIALSTLAWTGHGAVDEGVVGWIHLIADILHLLAAGAWVGALVGLVLLVMRPASRVDASHLRLTHRALHGFGAVGTVVVLTIVLSGLINSWLLVGLANVAALGKGLYGQLLLVKLALFGAMLGFAALNRFRLTPAFEKAIASGDHDRAGSALRRSLSAETACVIVILLIVAWLGTLSPPASGG